MRGLHLTADLYRCQCDTAWLTDAGRLGDWCAQVVQAVGLQVGGQLLHPYPAGMEGPGGVAITLLLQAPAHVCVHTWPSQAGATIDVYVSNAGGDHSAKARALMDALVRRFQPGWTEQRSLDRGDGE